MKNLAPTFGQLIKILQNLVSPDVVFCIKKCSLYVCGWSYAVDPTGKAQNAPPDSLGGLKRAYS